jgi:predicted negative regulator of RcsB-dependent stress response
MADKHAKDNAHEGFSLEDRSAELFHQVLEFFKRNQTGTYTALGLLVAAAAFWGFRGNMVHKATEQARGDMGQAFVRLEQGKTDSAAPYLQKVASENAGLESAKAALILGGIQIGQSQLDKAEASYRIALDKSQGLPLLWAGAQRGLAVCAIDRKDYKTAESLLRSILSKYQRVTGDAKARGLDEEPKDEVPFLSQVMWQLVLVRDAQGDHAGAIDQAKDLVKLYPSDEESQDARRYLALNGG